MRRLVLCSALLFVIGCQTPERAAIKPLPPDAPPLPYADLVTRAEEQVDAAQKFFYRDDWEVLAEAAVAIKSSATMLTKLKADDIPLKQREERDAYVKQLTEAADALSDAAKAKDANKTADAMQSLHKTVRQMRPRP